VCAGCLLAIHGDVRDAFRTASKKEAVRKSEVSDFRAVVIHQI
jgi:hypothetical protein